MPQKYSQKAVNTFVKGLVTEATDMTFPEGTSSAELNCDLLKNGARRRRKGLIYEANYQESPFTVNEGEFVHHATWSNVSGIAGAEYLIVQVESKLYFYSKSAKTTSAALLSFYLNTSATSQNFIDLTTYVVANDFQVNDEPIQVTSINGYLVITNPAINPIKIKYTKPSVATDPPNLTVEVITIKVRDFEFLDITTDPATYPATLTTNYKYDLFNIGWGSTENGRGQTSLSYWDNNRTLFPPRSKPWWVGKNGDAQMEINQIERIDGGNTLAPNGHFVLDFFSKNRSGVSGIAGITTVTESARFRATAPYAGRVWYAGLDSATNGGKIFFSKVIDKEQDFGLCYQVADPTSEDTAGVVDSDGGYLVIPDAANIRALYATGSMLLVFAQNGIWAIGGVDQIFKASSFFVRKISPFGIFSSRGLVDVLGAPIFWNTSGIYTITFDNVDNEKVENLSTTIKGYFDSISNTKKLEVTSIFDRTNRRVYWMYPDNDETVAHKLNNVLILDVDLGAFFPWKLTDTTGTTPYLMGAYFLSGLGTEPTDFNLLANTDNVVETVATITNVARTGNVATITTSAAHGFAVGNVVSVNSSNSAFNGLFTITTVTTTSPHRFTYAQVGAVVSTTSATGNAGEQIGQDLLSSTGTVGSDVKFIVKTASNKLTMAEFVNTDFLDWTSANYSSYAETGFDFMGEATTKKNNPYITTYMKRTEENFVIEDSQYVADYPSSCLLTVKWDLSRDSSRWSEPSQIYRMVNYPVVDPDDLTFTYPYDTIVSRTKIRGKGRVLRMKFESEQGKDFYLIGWENIIAGNPRF